MDWQKWEQASELLTRNKALLAAKAEQLKALEDLFNQERSVLEQIATLDKELQQNSDTIDRLQHEMTEG